MDEFSAILKARELVREAGIESVPVEIEKYLSVSRVNAVFRVDYNLPDDQAGSSTTISGRRVIFVNAKHSLERQRFTVLHEVGHIVLGLRSAHAAQTKASDLISYRKRPEEEILCDVFAAELLLPEPFFRSDIRSVPIDFASIEKLASRYQASLTSTGSRFAVLNEEPCIFILSEAGKVRYMSRSLPMRQLGGWVSLGLPIPEGTLTARKLRGTDEEGPVEIEAYRWLENEQKGARCLLEDVRLLTPWNQALTLLLFEESGDEEPGNFFEEDQEPGLHELKGILPWPSKRRRR